MAIARPSCRGKRGTRRSLQTTAFTMWLLACLAAATSGQETDGPDRGGFTLALDLGLGFQRDAYLQETETGLAGLNLGIGGFLRDDLALILRVSGTVANYPGFTQTSGVAAPALQYWPNDHLKLEAGAGLGYWRAQNGPSLDVSDTGLGLVLGVAYALFNSRKHSVQVGVEYAPAFTDPGAVHSVGIVVGWQLL